MTKRVKKDFKDLLPIQQRIAEALKKFNLSVRWLAKRLDIPYTMLWQKIWVNDKIDTEIVEKISRELSKFDSEFTLDYFMPTTSVHFSMPGHISKEEAARIKLLAQKLGEVSKSPEDTELVLSLVDRILTKKV